MSRRRAADIASEVFGPAPLLVIAYAAVGMVTSTIVLAVLVVTLMAVIPYALTVVMAHRGKVSDRFVGDRSQRVPILLGTFGCVVAGLAILFFAPSDTSQLLALTCIVLGALAVVIAISVKWKISIHATIAAFATGVLVVEFGVFLIPVAIVVCVVTSWARHYLRQHSAGQLLAGLAIGVVMSVSFAVVA